MADSLAVLYSSALSVILFTLLMVLKARKAKRKCEIVFQPFPGSLHVKRKPARRR